MKSREINQTNNKWVFILIKNNYSFAYEYKINIFYIDNNVKNIKERFIGIDELKKKIHKIKNIK